MPLKDLEISHDNFFVPDDVQKFITDAHQRVSDFLDNNPTVPGFVPSDFGRVYAALVGVLEGGMLTGRRFCEWGSGFGAVSGLARMLDFDVCGIEIEQDLVDEAEALAEDYELDIEYVRGSFIPDNLNDLADDLGDICWLITDVASAYDELGLDVDDFDIIFAYPWPGEEHVVERIFEASAATGAILVTYRGMEDLKFHRKV